MTAKKLSEYTIDAWTNNLDRIAKRDQIPQLLEFVGVDQEVYFGWLQLMLEGKNPGIGLKNCGLIHQFMSQLKIPYWPYDDNFTNSDTNDDRKRDVI